MKKIFLLVIVVSVSLRLNSQVIKIIEKIDQYTSQVVETYVNTENANYEVRISNDSPIKGVTGGHSWVQLWANGPRFAEFNIGSRITDYAQASQIDINNSGWEYAPWTVENCGAHFAFGGIVPDGYDTKQRSNGPCYGREDASTALWGNDWRMPSQEEFAALKSNADLEWLDGTEGHQIVMGCPLKGFKISGKAGTPYAENYIFLPATGSGYKQDVGIGVSDIGLITSYWVNSLYSETSAYAPQMKEFANGFDIDMGNHLFLESNWSFTIRAILNRGTQGQTIKILKNGQELTTYSSSNGKYSVKFEEGPVTKGVTGGHPWVQLWENGPKFAEFNVGSRITTYQNATEYNVANVGCTYVWGGFVNGCGPYKAADSDLTESEDLARSTWNTNWRMPTKAEICTLFNRETVFEGNVLQTPVTVWEYMDGTTGHQYESGCTLKGWKVSGKGNYAGNSIFLPCIDSNNHGTYWSSSYEGTHEHHAWGLDLIYQNNEPYINSKSREICCFVRAVLAD